MDATPWMRLALDEARLAAEEGEVPVGAVIVRDGTLIARAHNRREQSRSPLSHAEIDALKQASEALGSWRLADCTLVVTLEPCLMCIGAALQARIPELVFGCRDPKAGAVISLFQCAQDERLNHQIAVTEGVLADESAALLSGFFKSLREKRKG